MRVDLLERILGKKLRKGLNITPFLTIKTGQRLPYVFIIEDFSDWVKLSKLLKEGVKIFLIGGGSNLVIKEKKENILFVINRYSRKRLIQEGDDFVFLKVSSGYPISRLVKESVLKGWEGLEYHWGLPGTVGGAVYMNSKWTKPLSYVGDLVYEALLLDPKGNFKKVEKEYFNFAYDYSILQKTGEFLVEVVLKFKKEDPEILYKRAMEAYKYRRQTQPFGVFTSGCFFKNISADLKEKLGLPTTSAGYLIDKAGLKGLRVGDFEVSSVHANFIVNKGKGRVSDLMRLIEIIKKRVREKFDVELELEVVVV